MIHAQGAEGPPPTATVPDLCPAHGQEADCWMCWHDEISRDLDGCTVYLLYRDPLFEDGPWEEYEECA